MALLEKYTEVDCLWGIWKMEESVEDLLLYFSDPRKQEREMCHLTAEGRRLEWLSVRALLTELCGEEKQIEYLPSGRPFLSDRSYHISISHTRGYVAVILSPQREVGIDIEQYGERILKLRSKFMSKEELQVVSADREVYHLLLHWSAKETLFKLISEEEVDFKEHLRVYPFTPIEIGTFDAQEFRTEKQQKYLVHYQIHPNFVITWS